jgi:hypothetical protein
MEDPESLRQRDGKSVIRFHFCHVGSITSGKYILHSSQRLQVAEIMTTRAKKKVKWKGILKLYGAAWDLGGISNKEIESKHDIQKL